MRKLIEIIDDVTDGLEPTYDELLYSLLVYKSLHNLDQMTLLKIYEKPDRKLFGIEYQVEESMKRSQKWLNQDPKTTLGWENDPRNNDYLGRIKIERKILNNIVNKNDVN